MNSVITLHNISKTFREKPKVLTVLKDINLDIFGGEFFVCLGPSGSGKSTILRIMSGLEKDYDGEVRFGAGISSKDFSFVFQQFALLPWLTVYENVEMGLIARRWSKDSRREKVMKELKLFGLEEFATSLPKGLSGGMKQRVGLARALATDPKIIFMDEPFSELDSFTAEELRKELLHIWQERKMTTILVSHNIEEALELADRIAVLTPRPGRIEKVVENNLPRPRNKRSPEFYRFFDELYAIIKP